MINLSINNATSLSNIYKVYGFDIKIETKLSKKCDEKIFSSFDADTLKKSVFDNILFNSVWAVTGVKSFEEFEKTKKKEGTVKISTKKEDKSCIIEVYDTGCGIPEEDLKKIFKKGFTLRKSHGLGLYYAKQTLDKFNGKIEVESKKNKFTRFKVSLSV